MNCTNCNRELKPGERAYCERTHTTECAECAFHQANGTRAIDKFNDWLSKPKREGETR